MPGRVHAQNFRGKHYFQPPASGDSLLLVLAMACLSLTGCGSKESPKPGATATPPAAAPAAAPAPAEKPAAEAAAESKPEESKPAEATLGDAGKNPEAAAPSEATASEGAKPPALTPQALQAIPGLNLGNAAPGARPASFGSWKPEHFRQARAEGDPQLLAAIAALGPSKSSSENAARLLVELLQAPPAAASPAAPPAPAAAAPAAAPPPAAPVASLAPPAADGQTAAPMPPAATNAQPAPPPRPAEDAVVAVIIDALGSNQTPTARTALKRLLLGELKTAVPDAAVTGLAAKALLKKPTKQEVDMLLAAAVNAPLLRPGATPDPALQGQLLAAIDQQASSAVRMALVDAAIRKSASEEQRRAVFALLLKPSPLNLAAQARLFSSDKLDAASRADLERRFAAYSASTADRLLGLSSAAIPVAATPGEAAASEKLTDAAVLQGVVQQIWSEEVIAHLQSQGEDAASFADFADALQLAVGIPMRDMRTALGDLHQKHWSDGPDALKLGARFGDLVHDPGLLLVVKRVPRKEEPPEQKPRTERAAGRQRPQRGNREAGERAENEEKARYAWMKATEQFVESLNARFLAAAQAGAGHDHMITPGTTAKDAAAGRTATVSTRATSSAPAGEAAETEKQSAATRAGTFPLELHEGARIVAEYHMCLPDDLPKRLQKADITPLSVHYVRMEDTASLYKLNTHYKMQLKGSTSRPRSYGRWVDWMGQGVEHGQARTVDVIFTRKQAAQVTTPTDPAAEKPDDPEAKAAARRASEEPEPLVTEILVIEQPEYKVTPGEEAEKSKRKWKSGGADKSY